MRACVREFMCVFPCTEAMHSTLGVFKSQFEDEKKRYMAMNSAVRL